MRTNDPQHTRCLAEGRAGAGRGNRQRNDCQRRRHRPVVPVIWRALRCLFRTGRKPVSDEPQCRFLEQLRQQPQLSNARGYAIDLNSFALDVGGVSIPIIRSHRRADSRLRAAKQRIPPSSTASSSPTASTVDFPFPLAVNISKPVARARPDFHVGYKAMGAAKCGDFIAENSRRGGTYDLSAIRSYG